MKDQVNSFIYRTRLIECLISEEANISLLLLEVQREKEAENKYLNASLALDHVEWGDLEEFNKRFEVYISAHNEFIHLQQLVLQNIHRWVATAHASPLFRQGLTGDEIILWKDILIQAFNEREKRNWIERITAVNHLNDDDMDEIARIFTIED